MAIPNVRPRRVGELIQREVARLLQTDYRDVAKLATVLEVQLSPDLGHARIYISTLEDKKESQTKVDVLNEYAPLIRKALAGKIQLRSVPIIRFYYDPSIHEGNRISQLIEKAVKEDSQK